MATISPREISATTSTAKASSVNLLPWDPDSPEHVERMRQQRIACGWNMEEVDSWRQLQREGLINMWWIVRILGIYLWMDIPTFFALPVPLIFPKVLPEDNTQSQSMLSQHLTRFPSEERPLSDSATTFGGRSRTTPRSPESFHPIGHISIDSHNHKATLADPSIGRYCISKLYVSAALQSKGLGRAAMDAVEKYAAEEPLRAKTLTLDTISSAELGDGLSWAGLTVSAGGVCYCCHPWFSCVDVVSVLC